MKNSNAGKAAQRRKPSRRRAMAILGGAVVAVGAAVAWGVVSVGATKATEITVYKSPYCVCCGMWSEHMRANGFAVNVREVEDVDPVKALYGVPPALASCHTAVVDGYVVEGHVPANVVRRLLAERPEARGLAVPGMPAGSPGMEGAGREGYDVVIFDDRGKIAVYARR